MMQYDKSSDDKHLVSSTVIIGKGCQQREEHWTVISETGVLHAAAEDRSGGPKNLIPKPYGIRNYSGIKENES
jgi:hypothetical protein